VTACMDLKKIGIRYCGGCNPGYDRVALVMAFESTVKDLYEFSCHEEEDDDIIVFVNGCPRACADDNSTCRGIPFFSIIEADGFKNLAEWLASIRKKDG
jgi:hypothetical protein